MWPYRWWLWLPDRESYVLVSRRTETLNHIEAKSLSLGWFSDRTPLAYCSPRFARPAAASRTLASVPMRIYGLHKRRSLAWLPSYCTAEFDMNALRPSSCTATPYEVVLGVHAYRVNRAYKSEVTWWAVSRRHIAKTALWVPAVRAV